MDDQGTLTIIVDAANVMGSRPDGWWRDRAGAAARLRDELSALTVRGIGSLPEDVTLPSRDPCLHEIVLVVEGAARSVAASSGDADRSGSPGGAGLVRVVAADGSGDDTIARLARELPGVRLVVTADRELRRRCQQAGAAVVGPRWLLSQC
jgi:hypothetical protein